MTFPMTLDRFHRRSTIVIIVLLAVVFACVAAGVGLALAKVRAAGHGWVPLAVGGEIVLVAIIMGLAWAMAPRAVEVTGDELRVLRRSWPPFVVPLGEIIAVEAGPELRATGAIKLAGSGGFFGSYGLYWTKGFGRYRLYATSFGPSLALRRRDRLPVVLTPDDPDGLREAIGIWKSPPAISV